MNIAILIPCYNEEHSIANVVRACQKAMPHARIVVGDNNSRDKTCEKALEAGAEVIHCPIQGKGAAVKTLIDHVKADAYGMLDGDDTYCPEKFPIMFDILADDPNAFITMKREATNPKAYPRGHKIGNIGFNILAELLFGRNPGDLFSGQRVFGVSFLDHWTQKQTDFRIETEMSYAASQHCTLASITGPYRPRPIAGTSKLQTFPDGFRILCYMIRLVIKGR